MANAGGGILPAEYQQVEWLGTKNLSAYISTGIIIPDNYERLEIKIMPTVGVNSKYRYFGTWNANTSIMGYSGTGPLDTLRVGNNTFSGTASTQINTLYTIDITADNGSLNGTYCGVPVNTTYSGSVHTGVVEAIFYQGGICGYSNVYYYRLYTSAGLVRDFVPCYRKSDGKNGLYDLVSNTLFTDSGQWDQNFKMGPDV